MSSAETLALPRKKKAATIEFWRFAFTALVVVYHLEVNFKQRSLLISGVSAVEFFFILSGFLMAKSAYSAMSRRTEPLTVSEAHTLALDFVKKKLKAILPILLVVMVFWAAGVFISNPAASANASLGGGFGAPAMPEMSPFMTKLTTVLNSEYTLLMLVGTPAGFMFTTEAIPMWFLTSLLVIGYLYTFAINKRFDIMAFLAPALGVLCWIFFTLTVNPFTGGILDSSSPAGFLNTGMVKAISEMSLGVSMFLLYNYLSKKNLSRFWRVILSLLEIYAIIRFCMLTLNQPIQNTNYIRLVYIMIIVLLSFLNVTWISRLLDRTVFRWLGSISLAMYICHYYLKNLFVSVFMKEDPNVLYLPGTMQAKDALLYLLVVIVASVLIMLFLALIKRWIIRPLKERHMSREAVITDGKSDEAEPAAAVTGE